MKSRTEGLQRKEIMGGNVHSWGEYIQSSDKRAFSKPFYASDVDLRQKDKLAAEVKIVFVDFKT